MTIHQLRRRIQFWQKQLPELGVGHWWIDRIGIVDAPFGRENAKAAVWYSDQYDRCVFEFSHEVANGDPREIDRTIIHEWLHVALRDHDKAVESLEGFLSPQSWEVADDRINHEKEGVIDRLAFLIERLHRQSR